MLHLMTVSDGGDDDDVLMRIAVNGEGDNYGIVVLAAPFWSPGRSPPNVQVEEESSVEVDCQAHGTPKPDIAFMINGIPLTGK